MGLLPVLVYYASVAKGGRVLAEYKNRSSSRDLAPVVVECLEQVPPLHSRFTLTIKRRIFSCLLEGPFTYCCIVDEALGKSDAFGFLEAVRDEFVRFVDSRGLRRDGEGVEMMQAMIYKEFGSTMKVLTLPLIGVPQKEIDSLKAASPSSGSGPTALNGTFDSVPSPKMTEPLVYSGSERSDGVPDHLTRSVSRANRPVKSKKPNGALQASLGDGGGDHEEERLDIVIDTNNNNNNNALSIANNNGTVNQESSLGDLYPHRKSFSKREAENRWWRNVKIVLVVDVVICVLLFVIWLGVCRGFQCVS